ncbi:MAG: hypothetical protein RSE20_09260, partial [Eubacterium sp.]
FRDNIHNEIVTIRDANSVIERFNNPVFYKPIKDHLFIIPKEIPKLLLGHLFKFEWNQNQSGNLAIPESFKRSGDSKEYKGTLSDFLITFMQDFNDKTNSEKNTNYAKNTKSLADMRDSKYNRVKNGNFKIEKSSGGE